KLGFGRSPSFVALTSFAPPTIHLVFEHDRRWFAHGGVSFRLVGRRLVTAVQNLAGLAQDPVAVRRRGLAPLPHHRVVNHATARESRRTQSAWKRSLRSVLSV